MSARWFLLPLVVLIITGCGGDKDWADKEQVAVGHCPEGVAVGDDRVWLIDSDNRLVAYLDASDGDVVDKADLGEELYPDEIAFGGDRVAVLGRKDLGDFIREVDISDGSTLGEDIGLRGADWIAYGEGSLWAAQEIGGRVIRITPSTHEVVAVKPFAENQGRRFNDIAVGDGSVWISSPGVEGTVVRVDAATMELTGQFGVGGDPHGLALGDGSVWVANARAGAVDRLDARSGQRVTSPIAIPGDGAQELSFGEGAVWVLGGGTLSRIDPQSNSVTGSTPVDLNWTALAAGEGGVWVASCLEGGNGNIERIEPSAFSG